MIWAIWGCELSFSLAVLRRSPPGGDLNTAEAPPSRPQSPSPSPPIGLFYAPSPRRGLVEPGKATGRWGRGVEE